MKPQPKFYVAALTMLDGQGLFDEARQAAYLRYLEDGGVEGILVLGTSGEFPSFSTDERKAILETCMVNRGGLSVMAHVGSPSLPDTFELLEHAASSGAESVLAVPPFFYRNPPLEGLAVYYEAILHASPLPVHLYHIPRLSGAPISVELIRRLAEFPNLRGLKDSHNTPQGHAELVKEFPDLDIYAGFAECLTANLSNGGAGCITGNGSVLRRQTRAVFDAFRSGAGLEAAQSAVDDADAALGDFDWVPGWKYAVSLSGIPESPCRPPLVGLKDTQKAEAAERWRALL
ncbi:MAG: dihydrodipicolinate synthase family protein [Bryobacteraceae bacterium]|nr:dihydrodipicolinate synthase family protein [Bryobacteraceae bacterium]